MKWINEIEMRLNETNVEGVGYEIMLDAYKLINALRISLETLDNIHKISMKPDYLITVDFLGSMAESTLDSLRKDNE